MFSEGSRDTYMGHSTGSAGQGAWPCTPAGALSPRIGAPFSPPWGTGHGLTISAPSPAPPPPLRSRHRPRGDTRLMPSKGTPVGPQVRSPQSPRTRPLARLRPPNKARLPGTAEITVTDIAVTSMSRLSAGCRAVPESGPSTRAARNPALQAPSSGPRFTPPHLRSAPSRGCSC